MTKYVNELHERLFGSAADEVLRRLTLLAAMLGFLGHLGIWLAQELSVFTVPKTAEVLLSSPLAALYTPFSILLAYEVYQLIKAIPDSFSTAVGKQFEVATLLVVRDVFKRLSGIQFEGEWNINTELGLVFVECLTFLVLLYTAIAYQSASGSGGYSSERWETSRLKNFVYGKKVIAIFLLFTFGGIAGSSLFDWLLSLGVGEVTADRGIFFLDFFTCLILADIFVLLLSYKYSHDFLALVRNTGFVLSTVILRVAISAPGLSSMALFVVSGVLGIMVLRLTNRP